MTMPPSRRPGRPTRLGRWDVVAKIAGGGMSAIYLGRLIEAPRGADDPATVALKIVRADLRSDPRVPEMFLAEGELLRRLNHPNVVRTLEVATQPEAFIAMELLLGTTLAAVQDVCAHKGLRIHPEIAAYVAARVADALDYAHNLRGDLGEPLGLIHRDVNPANVFATFSGEVKLFDFGMAKIGESKSSPNIVKGKLPYLSPEQVMQLPLDHRSDVFGLGTTLWELLTARRLFRRDSDHETVRAVHVGPIPDPRDVAPEIPADLARITKKALERNREHRHQTAGELARDLDAFVQARGVPDSPARLGQLVDSLMPGEKKRQLGWLKPVIMPTPVSYRPPPPAPSSRRPGNKPKS